MPSRGFTMIELLVVVVIVGVLWATVTFAIGTVGGERQLERQAEQMRALVAFACEQAELSGREIGVSFNTRGYRFSRMSRDTWELFNVGELRPRTWLEATRAILTRDGHGVEIAKDPPEKPQLLCFSSGELTPFRLELALGDVAVRYRIDGQADGSVAVAMLQPNVR
jgi:general secretion pathway protein H